MTLCKKGSSRPEADIKIQNNLGSEGSEASCCNYG